MLVFRAQKELEGVRTTIWKLCIWIFRICDFFFRIWFFDHIFFTLRIFQFSFKNTLRIFGFFEKSKFSTDFFFDEKKSEKYFSLKNQKYLAWSETYPKQSF